MIPYYKDDLATIYLGDSEMLLQEIDADVVISDPPYGINYSPSESGKSQWTKKTFVGKTVVTNDNRKFDPTPLLRFPSLVLFGANNYADKLPPSTRWVIWDKRDGLNSNDFADCEMVYMSGKGVARIFRHRWMGAIRDSERDRSLVHPTQKPIAVMKYLIDQTKGIILDPYMGSGSTLVAAKILNRISIGIEIEERYCEIAARRLQDTTQGLWL